MAKIEQSVKDELIILRKELAFQKSEKEELLSQLNALKKIDTYKLTDFNQRDIYLHLPAAICMLRGSQHVIYLANDRYMQLIGRRDCIGKPIREALPELEGHGFFEILDGVYETRNPFIGNEMPVKLDKGDGIFAESYFNFVYQPSFDINGSMDGILIHAVEVTEQVLARKKIEESEHRYRTLIHSSPSLIAIFKGENMVIEIANDSVLESWGKGKDIIGKPVFEVMPETAEQGFDKLLLSVYKTGEPVYAYEIPITLIKNGEPHLMHYTFVYQAQLDMNGEIEGVAVLANEVTTQVEAKNKLTKSEKRFRILVEQASTPILILKGEDMILELANEPVFKIFNVGKEALGKPFLEILPEMKDQPFIGLLLDVLQNGVTHYGNEEPAYFIRENGEKDIVYFNFVIQPYFEDDGSISGVTVLANNVTELVLSKKKVEESDATFRMLIEQAPVAMAVFNGKEYIVEVANEYYLEIVGTQADFLGKPLFESLPELKIQGLQALMDNVMQSGTPYYGNEWEAFMMRDKKNRQGFYNFVFQPVKAKDGTVSKIIVVAIEITEQVNARRKVDVQNQLFSDMLMTAPGFVATLSGIDHVYELVNEKYQSLFGNRKIQGKPIMVALPELEGQGFDKLLDNVYNTGEPYVGINIPITLARNEGLAPEERYFNFSYQPMYDENKQIFSILVFGYEVTEQVIAAKKIASSEEQFRLLVEQAPVAICVLRGKNYVIEIINEGMYEMWDRTLEEALNKPAFEVLPELMDQGFKELLDNVYNTGQRFVAAELPVNLHRNGKIENTFVKFVYEPLREIDGTISGIMALAHEITEQVLSRKKIEESETKFRTLIEDAPVATCFFTGREMKIEVANDIMIDYWGKGKQIIGKQLADAVPELKDQPFLQILDDVFTTGKIYESKNSIAHLEVNGLMVTYYFNYTYKPIRNATGEVYGIINMAVDVTEQVLAMKNLEASEAQFSAMADNISQFAWMADETGWIYWYNKRWYDYTGTNHEEWQGWGWQKALHPDMAEEVIKSFKLAIEDGKDWEDTFLLRGKDGVYLWFLSRAVPLRNTEGKVIRWFGTNTDITEQKETNKKAEAATLMAEGAMKSKQQFLSNMSHEIRTPMNAIVGFTNVMLKTKLDENQNKYINAIKASGDSLIVLIDDILDLAKVDTGKMIFQIIPFKLSESMIEMLYLFEIKIQEKNLELVNQYDYTIPEILLGDPLRLHQIIINLISNAIKFTTKGKITLSVRLLEEDDEKATIEFSISDTGIGIPENRLEYIFGAFQQATSETSQLFGGTGLGLAIVKQLVENQKGTLAVTSKVGEGSNFSFVLSFKKTEVETAEEIDLEITPTIKNLKILVVEDVKLNQLLMKIILEDFGIEVDLADNGKIAVEKLNINNYDIIFMDLQMPEMNGFEATEYIRNKMNSQIPIIALTADVTTMDVEKCKAFGMNDYISKPIDEKLLYNKIIKYMPNLDLKKNS